MTLANSSTEGVRLKRVGRRPDGKSSLVLLREALDLLTREERWRAAGVLGVMIFGGLIEAAIVTAVMPLIWLIVEPSTLSDNPRFVWLLDALGNPALDESIPLIAGLTCGLIVIGTATTIGGQYITLRFAAACRSRLGRLLMSKLVNAPYLWLAERNGTVITRQLYADINSWSVGFVQTTLQAIQNMLLVILPSAVLLWMSPLFGIVALSLVGVLSVALILISQPRVQRYAREAKAAANTLVQVAVRTLGAAKDVRVSGRQDFFVDRFDLINSRLNDVNWRNKIWAAAPTYLIIAFGQIGLLAFTTGMWLKGYDSGEIAAQMALVVVVTSRVLPAVNRLMTQLTVFWSSLPYVEGILELTDSVGHAALPLPADAKREAVPGAWRSLSLRDVHFRYPSSDRTSLAACTLSFERGKRYGIVGPSGAGKSTLLDVLLGLIDPDGGEVLVDGASLARIDRAQWHRQVGYVPQHPFFFDDSLRRNVAFGVDDGEIDDDKVRRALVDAQLGLVLDALPQGLSTKLGERGVGLSGGQLQRVALARALYHDVTMLVLDEATSALDMASEAEVLAAVERLEGDILTISVAHRVASLRACDEIVVMEASRVVDTGRFDELLARCDAFRRLAQAHDDEAAPNAAAAPTDEPETPWL